MNKKYSTLLTMGLLLAGSLGGLTAQNLTFSQKYLGDAATKVTNGAKYILVQTDGATSKAYGFTDYDVDTKVVTDGAIDLTSPANDATYKKYVWTVTENGALGKKTVTFTNAATGQVLMVKKNAAQLLFNYTSTDGYSSEWAWNTNFQSYEDAIKNNGTAHLHPALALLDNGEQDVYGFITNPIAFATASNNNAVKLYSVKDIEVNDADLNKLYNSNGFNFALTTDGVENIFGSQKLKAIKVNQTIPAQSVGGTYTAGFPAGVYLAVSTPDGDYASATNQLDYLLNCEFIAVDPTENATSNANLRKEGQGFKFTTVSGKDLNLFIDSRTSAQTTYAAKMTSGAEISVKNACFTVTKNFDGDKYALSLGAMRYQQVSGAAAHAEAAVKVNIMSDLNYVSGKTLATATGDNAFIFKFAESTIESPAKLLSKEGAAIYNVQFVGGRANGTYLTDRTESHYEMIVDANGDPVLDANGDPTYNLITETAYYTKGNVLADLNDPANQYIITNVSGSNITFMNRLTKNTFVTKLYNEEDGCYSLNITNGSIANVIDLDEDNDMENRYDVRMNGAHVKLLPAASTDAYNTYWTAEDETLVTLAFARDNTPTSNKIYPAVDYDRHVFADKMTDDVVKAAQWQLKVDRNDSITYQTQTYAYLDANSKVVYKTKGDTIAAVNYNLELIEDGNPSGYYLVLGNNGDYTISRNSAAQFKIKDNFDGSVSITTALDNFAHVAVSKYWDGELKDLDRTMKYFGTDMVYRTYSTDIKTYLIQDAPEVSLPIETTFVTMQSEMGNYISMNEDQDGILVNIEPSTFKVFATDSTKAVPSFYVSFGKNEDGSRAFMFNPQDSVSYYVGAGAYDKEYEWAEGATKVIFKDAILNETADTLTTSIKGKLANVATKADRNGTLAGLDKFKFQIVKADPEEDAYIIRQVGVGYVAAINGKLTLDADRTSAVLLNIENTTAPTANAAIEAAGVQVIGGQGVVTVQGAAGKVVTVANILGQTIANQVAASDNVTIAVPAGIVVVSVDGEATKVVVK